MRRYGGVVVGDGLGVSISSSVTARRQMRTSSIDPFSRSLHGAFGHELFAPITIPSVLAV